MDYVTLGRTGLRVSVLGLGGGGHSRLGQRTGATEDQSTAIVRRSLDLGVNFIDTAEAYGTEPFVGAALRDVKREDVILSTKKSLARQGHFISVAELIAGLEASLTRLQTDYVDIYHLHGVNPSQYDQAVTELVPAMEKLREQGKIRFIGITESFGQDPGHVMLTRAVQDPYWDVMMVGFNLLNQSARDRVFATTQPQQIGVLCMYAVRDALSQHDKLLQTIQELVAQGLIDPVEVDVQNPLGFLREVTASVPDAAYRFCQAEPGIDVVLSGTGNVHHLEQNVASVLGPPLPEAMHRRLVDIFARVDTVTG